MSNHPEEDQSSQPAKPEAFVVVIMGAVLSLVLAVIAGALVAIPDIEGVEQRVIKAEEIYGIEILEIEHDFFGNGERMLIIDDRGERLNCELPTLFDSAHMGPLQDCSPVQE